MENTQQINQHIEHKNLKSDIIRMSVFLIALAAAFITILIVSAIFLRNRFPDFEDNLSREISSIIELIKDKEESKSVKNFDTGIESMEKKSKSPSSPQNNKSNTKTSVNVNNIVAVVGGCNTCGQQECVLYKNQGNLIDISGCFTDLEYNELLKHITNMKVAQDSLLYYQSRYDENGCEIKNPQICFLSIKDRITQLSNDVEYYENEIYKITQKGN